MSAADDAYKAAESAIAKARASSATVLNLDTEATHALTRLPPDIGTLTDLELLLLDNTQVTDLSPLAQITGLTELWLANAQVTDLTPLAQITGLTTLFLDNTQVTDLTPLARITGLTTLHLSNTQVADLRPIRDLTSLIDGAKERGPFHPGLNFRNTPAARATPDLTRLSKIEDDAERTEATLAYLHTLPPWPQPLPWDTPPSANNPYDPDEDPPSPPGARPAPLQVAFDGDVLRQMSPGDGLDDVLHTRAQQGWAALIEYLSELEDQRPRIGNSLPRLAKALDALERALGTDYDTINPIGVGTQGERVIRLSVNAGESLMDEDAADIAEFAAALTLFLSRFPDWMAYKADVIIAHPDANAVAQSLPLIREVTDELKDKPEIDPRVPESLDAQIEVTSDDPQDALSATGTFASVGNVLNALAEKSMEAIRWVKRESLDIAGRSWDKTKTAIAISVSVAAATALGILVAKAGALNALATQYPTIYGWLEPFLRSIGL